MLRQTITFVDDCGRPQIRASSYLTALRSNAATLESPFAAMSDGTSVKKGRVFHPGSAKSAGSFILIVASPRPGGYLRSVAK
jgi:hypothetical protein